VAGIDPGLQDGLTILAVRDTKGRQQREILYRRRKMTAWLARGGFPDVCRHTVDRLMLLECMNDLVRGRKPRGTVSGKASARAAEMLQRNFSGPRPNHSSVTDFTCVLRFKDGVGSCTWLSRSNCFPGPSWAGPPRR